MTNKNVTIFVGNNLKFQTYIIMHNFYALQGYTYFYFQHILCNSGKNM